MGSYQLDGSIEFWAYAQATATDVATRIDAAILLAHEIVTAIENAHASASFTTLHSQLAQLLIEILDVFGDGPELAGGPPFVHGRISYQAFPDRGI